MIRTRIIFALALVTFLVAAALYVSAYQSISTESAESSSLDFSLSARSLAVARSAQTNELLSNLSSEGAALNAYFVSEQDIAPFVERLQSIGASAGAQVSALSIAESTEGQPGFAIALSVTGSFDHVMRAVGAIEFAPYDLTISNLALSSSKGVWQATFTAVVGATSLTNS